MFPSLFGLILTLVFIAPGFVVIGGIERKYPLKSLTTFEKTIYSLVYSVLINSLLCSLLFLVLWLLDRFRLFKELVFDSESRLDALPYLVLLFFVYALISLLCGHVAGKFLGLRYTRKAAFLAYTPVWHRVFRDDAINYARVELNNGKIYIGQMHLVPEGYESLQSPDKDFALFRPLTYHQERLYDLFKEESIESVLLNTKDVVSIEVAWGQEG